MPFWLDSYWEYIYSRIRSLVLFCEYICFETVFDRSKMNCYCYECILVYWNSFLSDRAMTICDFLGYCTWFWHADRWIFWYKTYHKNWKSCTSEYTSLHYNFFCLLLPLSFFSCLIIQNSSISISVVN